MNKGNTYHFKSPQTEASDRTPAIIFHHFMIKLIPRRLKLFRFPIIAPSTKIDGWILARPHFEADLSIVNTINGRLYCEEVQSLV